MIHDLFKISPRLNVRSIAREVVAFVAYYALAVAMFAVLASSSLCHAQPAHPPIALDSIIAAAKGPIVLQANSLYVLSATANLKYSLDGNGSTIDLPTNQTDFKAIAPDVTIARFVAPKAGLFFESAANHCGVENCKIGVGSPSGSVGQAFKTLPGGTNSFFTGNSVGVTTTVSIYFDESGVWCTDNTLAGSINEYAFRFDVPASGITQSGATFSGNTVSNNNGCKDAGGVRQFFNVTMEGNTFTGDVRWGQVPGAGTPATKSVGQFASGTVTGNHFTSNGMAISLVEVYQGVSLRLNNNTFTNPLAPPVSADTLSQITGGTNTEQAYAGAKAWEFFATSSKGKYAATGGDKMVTVPAAK
jgi:hypothetical protein